MQKQSGLGGHMKITIKGRLPDANDYIAECRNNKYGANNVKRRAENNIGLQLSGQRVHKFTGPVILHFVWYEANRKRDLDNIAFGKKFIQDALVRAGILAGDGWRHVAGFTDRFEVDKGNPRVEITVEEAAGNTPPGRVQGRRNGDLFKTMSE